MNSKPRAFTLIEIMIVVFIMGVLSTVIAFSFQNAQSQALFNEQKSEITNIIQEARSLSLSNILVNDSEPTDFYILSINQNEIELRATYNSDSGRQDELISSYTLDEGFLITDSTEELALIEPIEIYYYPPYGEICIRDDCEDGADSEISFYLSEENDEPRILEFTIDVYGGFPEVSEL